LIRAREGKTNLDVVAGVSPVTLGLEVSEVLFK
jgi:hypothetical protein